MLGPVVAELLHAYADGTTSQGAIAVRLTQLRGKPTRQTTVTKMLRNPFYVGTVGFNGQSKPGRHEPLVTPEVWERLQDRLAGGRHGRTPASMGPAGSSVPLYRRGRGAERQSLERNALLCCSGMDDGCPGVGAPRVVDLHDALYARALVEAAAHTDETPTAAALRAPARPGQEQLQRLRQERDRLAKARANAGRLGSEGVMDEDDYRVAVAAIAVDLQAVDGQLAELERAAVRRPSREQLASAADRVQRLWEVMTPAERQAAGRLLLGPVRLRPPALREQDVRERLVFPELEGT